MTATTPPRYGQIDHGYGLRLATTAPDDDGPVWMINLMSYRDAADYADGRDAAITGREADDEYTPLGPLAAVGAEVVFVADVEDQFLGEEPQWDRVAVAMKCMHVDPRRIRGGRKNYAVVCTAPLTYIVI